MGFGVGKMGRVDCHNMGQWHEWARQAGYKRDRLSKLLQVCPRHLQRLTRQVFGLSPQEWLNQQRLKVALGLLQQHRSVKRVAYELGFKQVSHFSREFKGHYGVTPTGFLSRADKQKAGMPDVPPR
jgi:AraC-like DNA-binding protein